LPGSCLMFNIRAGQMDDCKDLLTVYRTTRWPGRRYATVEEVKDEHRGSLFRKWGWLVAETEGTVVGEITFRTEANPTTGLVGQITGLDVDVRHQRQSIGRVLTKDAERILSARGVNRIFVDSPPGAYNYWMKLNYFAKGGAARLTTNSRTVVSGKRKRLQRTALDAAHSVPSYLQFHNLAYPCLLSHVASRILDGGLRGTVMEFRSDDTLVGVGAAFRNGDASAFICADVTTDGASHIEGVIAETVRAAHGLGAGTVQTIAPVEAIATYRAVTDWDVQPFPNVPVMRLL